MPPKNQPNPRKNNNNTYSFKSLEELVNPKRKPAAAKNRVSPSEHMLTLHQRLYQALNLGIIKCRDNEGRKWQCTDIEIQRLTVRSISAFVGCITPDMLQHPLVKDSVADMMVALIGITQSRNEVVLGMAAEVTVSFVGILGNLIPFHQLSKLVGSFSCLLSFHQSSIAASCANALNHILSKMAPRRLKSHNEVWEVLKECKAVDCIVCSLQDFISGSKPYEYFQTMSSLLKTILWRWPPSRYPVWNNVKLVEGLGAICIRPDSSVEVAVLQLYSAIALCGNGAHKLLQNGETFLPIVLHCMDSSQPHSVRMEAFKLAQLLVKSEEGWLTIARTRSESLVEVIIDAMGGRNLWSGKVPTDQVPLLAEACKLALITRWAGEHHKYFWKLGVDKVLLNLVHDDFYQSKHSQTILSLEELIAAARKGLDANYLGVLRPYIWAILGWLAIHCPEEFIPNPRENSGLNILITCGCLILMDTLNKGRQNFLDVFLRLEPASRAVLLMIHSPCKYISSQASDILYELSTPNVEAYLQYILGTINSSKIGEKFNVLNKDQTTIDLMILSSLSSLPKYQNFIIQSDGITILSAFTKWCLNNNADLAPASHSSSNSRTCCMLDMQDWEGGDNLLFFSLWGLVKLIRPSRSVKNHGEQISGQVIGGVNSRTSGLQILVDKLRNVSGCASASSGVRWCAAYILSYFGFYGFPSRFGARVHNALYEKELADIHLKLSTGECRQVHGVILMVRCPSMLPSGELPSKERMWDGSSVGQDDIDQWCRNFPKEVRLSARVDHSALMELLEFVYTGFVQVADNHVKQLKMLARGCELHSLSHLLGRKPPRWGTTVPYCDFTPALGPSGRHFSDIILEAKCDEVVEWTCRYCSSSLPHIHVHKIILWLSCDYFKALFQSGMQERSVMKNIQVYICEPSNLFAMQYQLLDLFKTGYSTYSDPQNLTVVVTDSSVLCANIAGISPNIHSQNIKVPVSWEALSKLVSWFYSDELPKPSSGCIWNNMDIEHQLQEVRPFVELCWLAEFWLLDDFRQDTLRVVVSCLRSSSRNLPLKIIQIAAKLSQWEIVEVAANCLAPLYPHLRDSGDLGFLNEELVDMVRVAYVRLSQVGDTDFSD